MIISTTRYLNQLVMLRNTDVICLPGFYVIINVCMYKVTDRQYLICARVSVIFSGFLHHFNEPK